MRFIKITRSISGYLYRCQGINCSKTKSLIKEIDQGLPKIQLSKFLLAAYLYFLKTTNYQAVIMCSISEKSYILLKDIFILSLGNIYDNFEILKVWGDFSD
ncbi:hypothetical protein DMUE_0893 [Dictyocoela muelleri]|nr:hypothetical protein DMUE_0893 [Dictyocoela muelleri]